MEDTQKKTGGVVTYKDWSKVEKFQLINALKDVGRKDFEKIHEYIPTKSIEEIKSAIDYNLKTAYQHPEYKKYLLKVDQKHKTKQGDPLSSWEKKLKDSYSSDELRTETATALRIIADCENIPSPALTENIDFREVYRQMANAMEGKPVTADVATTAILKKCITETALTSKAFQKNSISKHITNMMNEPNSDLGNTFPKPTENPELAILRQLTSQKKYNPLKLPEAYLKPFCESPQPPK